VPSGAAMVPPKSQSTTSPARITRLPGSWCGLAAFSPAATMAKLTRWWTPEEFAELGAYAEGFGFRHVEAGPLVRSSYHAKRATAVPVT